MILLVDTGSLGQLYSSIKNDLAGDLLIINNVTTAIALDVGIKMLGRCSFLDIVRLPGRHMPLKSSTLRSVQRQEYHRILHVGCGNCRKTSGGHVQGI